MKRMLSVIAFVLAAACGANPAAPAPSASLSAGRWAGTTSQGAAITFEVSADEALTTITVGYRFNFSDRTSPSGPATTVNGVFLPGSRAQGQAEFRDYPGFGTATGVQWTATRR